MNNERSKDLLSQTEDFWPDKITLKEFVSLVQDGLDAFEENLNNIKHFQDPRWIEEWFCTMKRWFDCKEKKDFL